MSKTKLKDLENRNFKNIREQSDFSMKSYKEILLWFEYICSSGEMNDVEFIYRPHPSEPITEDVQNLEKEYNNFHVIRDFAIRDWLVNSKLAFSWNSTSSIEAVFAGVKVFSLRPFEFQDEQKFELLENIERLKTKEDLLHCIKYCLENNNVKINEKFKREINYYYSILDKPAVDITVEYINKIYDEEDYLVSGARNIVVMGIIKYLNYILKKVLHHTRILNKISKFKILSNDYMTKREFEDYKNKISKLR